MLISRTFYFFISLAVGMMFMSGSQADEIVKAGNSLELAVKNLDVRSYRKKQTLITTIGRIDDPRRVPILNAILKGNLYYVKTTKQMLIVDKKPDQYIATDALTLKKTGVIDQDTLKKVKINNKLRRVIRSLLAKINLYSDNADVRLSGVKNIIKTSRPKDVQLLRKLVAKEKSDKVREAMLAGIALVDINSDDKAVRLKSIEVLGESLLPEAKNALEDLLTKDDQGKYDEPDEDIRNAASRALENIESSLSFYGFIETAFFGLSLGSVLLLIAIGLSITFGVMGVINMAHGELMMIGAYTAYVVQLAMPDYLEYSLLVSVPLSFIVAGLFGVIIERTVIRHLYGRPLETLLATFGISLILQQMVRSIFSPLNRSVSTPSWMSGSLEINDALSLTNNRLYIIVFSLIVFFLLLLILKKTRLGLQVRAVSQNRPMAKAVGVRSEWVDALTFGLGSGVAGVAGVALSQITNVGPNLGQTYIIDSFMVVVFGGVGNLWGTFVSAMSLGVFGKFIEPWSGAVMAKILVLILIILFIQKKPRGLFPQKGRSVDN